MKKYKILLLSIASSFGALAADITVSPGELEDKLSSVKESFLTLKGNIDARDLAALEFLPAGVKNLDMSAVTIEALITPSRKYFGRTLFKEGEIPAYTFFRSGVSAIVLPAGTSAIGEGAFAGSDIRELVVPDGVTSIGDYAFYGCHSLTSVILPSSLKEIGKGAFGKCTLLTEIDLSKSGVAVVPEKAFAGAVSLESVKLPATVAAVGREAFAHTKISSLSLSNVTDFEEYALSGMPFLTSLALNPDAIAGNGLLMDDISLESLTGTPEMVPAYFAANCGSLSAKALETASSLGDYSFANTVAPETLLLPESLSYIGRGALTGLSRIKKIYATALNGLIPGVDDDAFEGISQPDIELVVSDNSVDAWRSHPQWGLFNVLSESETGIETLTVDSASDISISLCGGMLAISSAAVITDLRIYTADGRMAFVSSPGRESVEVETAALPKGVVIVVAGDTDGNSKSLSIIL